MKRSFTLVDLLVSLGVIALLMGILLPVLARAREASRGHECKMQVRTVTLAICAFANERNRLPEVPLYGGWWPMNPPYTPDEHAINVAAALRFQLAEWLEPCDEPVWQAYTRPWCCPLDGLELWKASGVSYAADFSMQWARRNIAEYEQNPRLILWRDRKAQRDGVLNAGRFDGSVTGE